MMDLYEPLLERDEPAIRSAIRDFRRTRTSEELFNAIAHFAVLAFAPSQHSKHAMIACVSAWDVREDAGDRWDDLLTECAIYAAASRQPWSEPPITTPPALEPGQRGGIGELREAVATGDRLRGERWLAHRLRDRNLSRDFFTVATDDFEDLGHKLIVAVNAWRLSQMFPAYPTLRTAIWEMTSYRGDARSPVTGDLIERMIASRGEIESAHALFVLDAALQTGDAEIMKRVGPALAGHDRQKPVHTRFETYRLARDCGACLKSFAVAKRLGDARIIAAAKDNLQHAPSLEDFSFA
ncbi:MAG TPA: hypothetical protein VL284_11260 [Thermoanaerobaculia bacterium]|nr:hypothetical protein [Thermoanaerobaculia bacterium]